MGLRGTENIWDTFLTFLAGGMVETDEKREKNECQKGSGPRKQILLKETDQRVGPLPLHLWLDRVVLLQEPTGSFKTLMLQPHPRPMKSCLPRGGTTRHWDPFTEYICTPHKKEMAIMWHDGDVSWDSSGNPITTLYMQRCVYTRMYKIDVLYCKLTQC